MEKNPMSVAVALAAFVLAAGVGLSEAAVYKVGDSDGWTILNSPNYTAWASSKSFSVGDVLSFVYNAAFHNVLEVTKTNYGSCNAASPLKTYTSGNDSITITSKGHHYFICGFPGHCDAGQKVDIKASSKSSSAAPSSSPTASPSSSPTSSPASSGGIGGGISPTAPTPKPSSGTRAAPTVLAVALAVVTVAAMSSGLLMQQLL